MESSLNVQLLHQNARLPTRAHPDDAGLDLYSVDTVFLRRLLVRTIKIGIAVEIPTGYYGQIELRSGWARKHGIVRSTSGVIDASYRGELEIPVILLGEEFVKVEVGDRPAQLLILPCALPAPIEVKSLSQTARNSGGFGSTGR